MGRPKPVSNMSHRVPIEREEDEETYWVPIPIHRVDSTDKPQNTGEPKSLNIPVEQQRSEKQATSVPVNRPRSQSRPQNQQSDDDDIFPRKRRSDLYDEIESRKYIGKVNYKRK